MINTKIMTIVSIIFALLLGIKLSTSVFDTKENFFGTLPTFTMKVDREYAGKNGAGFFTVPGNYQASLSPRFSNLNYGAYIKYNMPSLKNQGVPNDPLTYSNMADDAIKLSLSSNNKENLSTNLGSTQTKECFGSGAVGCRKGGGGMPAGTPFTTASDSVDSRFITANYSAGNYQKEQTKLKDYVNVTDMLPVGDMTMLSSDGNINQPIVYDRLMYANQKSFLYGAGDPIRGDLPIVPCMNEWFRPSVHPQIDLRMGAMMVAGGIDNSTNQQLAALQNASSGGLYNIGSGVSYTVDKTPYLTTGGGDIQVTAFP